MMADDSKPNSTLIEKIVALPPERAAEVEAFVDLMGERDRDATLARAALHASQAAFAAIWCNSEDDVYDGV